MLFFLLPVLVYFPGIPGYRVFKDDNVFEATEVKIFLNYFFVAGRIPIQIRSWIRICTAQIITDPDSGGSERFGTLHQNSSFRIKMHFDILNIADLSL